jgi:hypothetical protein
MIYAHRLEDFIQFHCFLNDVSPIYAEVMLKMDQRNKNACINFKNNLRNHCQPFESASVSYTKLTKTSYFFPF